MPLHALERRPQPARIVSHMISESSERGIESLKEASITAHLPVSIGTRVLDQPAVVDEAARTRRQRHPLRAMLVEGQPALLLEGSARDRIQLASVQADQSLSLEVVAESS